jgi:hypothetical protein
VREERIDRIGWGLFLLMTGVLWLLPEGRVPSGTWLVGTGLLLLALTAVRHSAGARVSGVLTVLGALMLAGGLAELGGVSLPLLAIGLIVFGAVMVLKPFVAPKR